MDARVDSVHVWLRALGGLTAAVNAGTDLTALLNLLASTARELLALDFCAVMLPASGEDHLVICGSSGLPAEYVANINERRRIKLSPDAISAPASRSFYSGKPCSVSDIEAEPSSSWADVPREQGYRSILAVPLATSTGTIGTLNSYRSEVHEFTLQEIEHLQLLAEHATLSINSARILKDLREKHDLIKRSEEIHDRLVGVAIQAGGIHGIARTLGELLACPVAVVDTSGETLATCGVTDADSLTVETSCPAPPQQPLVREHGRHAVANVVLENSVVANIWLLGQASKLDPLGIRAIEHAAVLLSLEVLRRRTATEVEQSVRRELLADILGGADPSSPSMRDRAHLLGHDLEGECTVYIARPNGVGNKRKIAKQAAAIAGRRVAHIHPRPLITASQNVVVALWPPDSNAIAADELLRKAISAVVGPGTITTVAAAHSSASGIAAAHRLAQGLLAFATIDGDCPGLVTADSLGAAGLLLQFGAPEELRRFALRTLGPVITYDADNGTELVATLRTVIDSDLDRRVAAERLVVHPNTVTQRMRRIEDLTGLNLRASRTLLDARMALTLIDIVESVGPAAT